MGVLAVRIRTNSQVAVVLIEGDKVHRHNEVRRTICSTELYVPEKFGLHYGPWRHYRWYSRSTGYSKTTLQNVCEDNL